MTDTAIFSFARADDDVVNIRTAVIDGDPWFVATDVCRALNLNLNKGASPHLLKLSDSERSTVQAATFGPQSNKGGRGGLRGGTSLSIVSESGLYKLILRSDKEEAVVFQNWVTQEVLPSIRRTGKYALADHGREAMPLPMDIAEALGRLTLQVETLTTALNTLLERQEQDRSAAELDRMVTAREAVAMGFGGALHVTEVGLALTEYCRQTGLKIGRRRQSGPYKSVNTYPMRAVKGRFG